jgi:hypothetical protein
MPVRRPAALSAVGRRCPSGHRTDTSLPKIGQNCFQYRDIFLAQLTDFEVLYGTYFFLA